MRKIIPSGEFLPQDAQGFIINDLALENIDRDWQDAISVVSNFYEKYFKQKLHSLYLRGSVARGLAVKGFSDLDVFAIVNTNEFIRWQAVSFQQKLERELEKFDFIKGIDAGWASFEKHFHQKNPRLAMILQTQSLCILGNSLSPTLPEYKANHEMCLNLKWLESDLKAFSTLLQQHKITPNDIQQIMKVMIRSGFEIIIEQEKRYTPDLYLSYSTFSKYHPNQETNMRRALEYYLNPTLNYPQLKALITELGDFLLAENTYNAC